VPVYTFGYDWRQPLDETESQLASFIDEVVERTRLMRHYVKAGYEAAPKVNLVGHSMGGLVIAGALERLGRRARVAKVATLATPFCGSFESSSSRPARRLWARARQARANARRRA
jgi:triacylglycerol esterase/lipase EstA (alpha/beta hydrolase family)